MYDSGRAIGLDGLSKDLIRMPRHTHERAILVYLLHIQIKEKPSGWNTASYKVIVFPHPILDPLFDHHEEERIKICC